MSHSSEGGAHAGHDAHGNVVVDHSHHVHVCTPRMFFGIYVALLTLTVLTVAVSRLDFGGFNMIIAMVVAAMKASLVMTVFMHLRWDTATNNIAFLSSILFLSLLFLFTIADFATRADADPTLTRASHVPVERRDDVKGQQFWKGRGEH
jgi:cytochrome c oxidase subunit 4